MASAATQCALGGLGTVKLFYTDHFDLPLPSGHRFPMALLIWRFTWRVRILMKGIGLADLR